MGTLQTLTWIATNDGWEAHVPEGGVFARIDPFPSKQGVYQWTLASDAFRSSLGPRGGACREFRHAKRSVERIRSHMLVAQSKTEEFEKLLIIDDSVETICDRLRLDVTRKFSWRGRDFSVEYKFNIGGVEIDLNHREITHRVTKNAGINLMINTMKEIMLQKNRAAADGGAVIIIHPVPKN